VRGKSNEYKRENTINFFLFDCCSFAYFTIPVDELGHAWWDAVKDFRQKQHLDESLRVALQVLEQEFRW
jgi:hypothetical protein